MNDKEALCNELLRGVGYDLNQIKAQADTAGKWSNLQNWMSDIISTTPQLVALGMLIGRASPLLRAWTNFFLSGLTLVGTPIVGTYYINPCWRSSA